MEPKFQTSFIPKKPIIAGQSSGFTVVRQTNIFSVIATILFLVTVLTSGALFLYKTFLQGQITDADKKINVARSAFQPEKIKDLLEFNSRVVVSKRLLTGHVVVSRFLHLLEADTVKNIRLTGLEYKNQSNAHTVTMKGEAKSYNALAQQQNIFSQNDFIKNSQFSDFTLGENGLITIHFSATLVPDLVSYKKAVELISGGQ